VRLHQKSSDARVHQASIHTVPIGGPGDVGPIAALFDTGTLLPTDICGVIAQTEGDGYARGFFAFSLELLLSQRLGVPREAIAARVPILVIGGTAGLMVPHVTLFCRREVGDLAPVQDTALALGIAFTRDLGPAEVGTAIQANLVADAVRAAMADAGIDSTDAVAGVEMKCPQPPEAGDPAFVGARSRGASALGAAMALGEVDAGTVTNETIGTRPDLFTARGSASSGTELRNVRVVVIGNRPGAPGTFRAGSGVMTDQLDMSGACAAFTAAGLKPTGGCLAPAETAKLAAVFVNAGADYAPACRGYRNTMKSDFLAGYSGHIPKAVAHATVSAIAQTPLMLGNAGAEHQGPTGSNLIFVIANHAASG